MKVFELTIRTADGKFVARYSEKGLCELSFPDGKERKARNCEEAPSRIQKWHELTVRALNEALAGRIPENFPPIDLSAGTEFQRRVWETMLMIPAGRTLSYGEIAERIGKPKAVRAVGGACGANPVPVFVPCHRVLAANRRLGGFSGGLAWKRKLLEREGIELAV